MSEDRGAATPNAREEELGFTLELSLGEGYAQTVDFGLPGVPALVVDEPEPLGASSGPNPARVLGAALGSCLGASLLFCLRKARIDVLGLRTHVSGATARNERGRLRIQRVDVRLEPVVPAEQQPRMARCLEIFEDFCVVTGSVREGVDVRVEVVPSDAPR
ncbi:MAG TPA: OsmC family protein [Gemmatimonadaceae bacterium]